MTTETVGTHAEWAFVEHEHRYLARGINHIHDVADEIGSRPTPELSTHILGILYWLDATLEPHIAWEEAWLYPTIDARLGSPWATRAARFDHRQLREMTRKLTADRDLLDGSSPADTRCHLFGLEALLRAHLEREERFLIPILDEDSALS